MPNKLNNILVEYVNEVSKIFGSTLQQIILYGSYAREDYTENSDIDIMILVDMDDEGIKKYFDDVCDLTFEYNLEHDIILSPVIQDINQFNYWLPAIPFYQSVAREGVVLNG